MIKIRLRKNLLYLFVYYLGWYIRKIINMIIKYLFNYSLTYIFLYLMTLGEIIGGFSIFMYQNNSWKEKKKTKYFELKLIYNEKEEIEVADGRFKRIILIFLAAFFDFMEFIIFYFYVPLMDSKITPTIDFRFGCLTTIVSSLIYTNALRFKIGKHHKISLLFMSLGVLLSLIIEIIFQPDNKSFGRFIFVRFLVCFYLMCVSFTDCTEKYLVEFNYMNPFQILMIEGIFESFLDIIFSIGNDPFKDIKKLYKEKTTRELFLFIFLLFLYLSVSTIVNTYKIYCNVIYSPMARSLIDYLMGPFFNIYFFIWENDFQNNYVYFFTSEIANVITVFFSCVYNEYIILFCCGIAHDTKDEIIIRSLNKYNKTADYKLGEATDDEDESSNTLTSH